MGELIIFLIVISISIGTVKLLWNIFKRLWYELSIRAFNRTTKRIVKFNKKILKEKYYV